MTPTVEFPRCSEKVLRESPNSRYSRGTQIALRRNLGSKIDLPLSNKPDKTNYARKTKQITREHLLSELRADIFDQVGCALRHLISSMHDVFYLFSRRLQQRHSPTRVALTGIVFSSPEPRHDFLRSANRAYLRRSLAGIVRRRHAARIYWSWSLSRPRFVLFSFVITAREAILGTASLFLVSFARTCAELRPPVYGESWKDLVESEANRNRTPMVLVGIFLGASNSRDGNRDQRRCELDQSQVRRWRKRRTNEIRQNRKRHDVVEPCSSYRNREIRFAWLYNDKCLSFELRVGALYY